ncbi:hypothetical protein, partial [Luedemannella helvata]|uniref:hypothetical protein n=1 Tax=Luedemannella helvata TaxID=349315 RepID=UPI0031DCED3B
MIALHQPAQRPEQANLHHPAFWMLAKSYGVHEYRFKLGEARWVSCVKDLGQFLGWLLRRE